MEQIKKLMLETAEKNGWTKENLDKLNIELNELFKIEDLISIRGKLLKLAK